MSELIANQAPLADSALAHQRRARRRPIVSVALHAALMTASFIAVFPIVWIVLSSFTPGVWVHGSELTLVKEPTLDNYAFLLTQTNSPRWFLNSVIVAAFTMVLGVAMSATTGYALSRYNFPGRRSLMLVFL